jgi:hypothetical protein
MTKRTIMGLKMADLKTFSMHDPIQKGEEGNYEDIIADSCASTPEEIIENLENLDRLRNLITNLDEREQKILILRYGLDGNLPKTLEEVSVLIGRTRERVRQIQMQSLKKLKSFIDDRHIDNDGNLRPLINHLNSIHSYPEQGKKNGKRKSLKLNHHYDKSIHRKNNVMAMKIPLIKKLIDEQSELQEDFLSSCSVSVNDLPLSRRSLNGLHSIKVDTVGQLINKSAEELLQIRYFGVKCLVEVQEAIEEFVKNLS